MLSKVFYVLVFFVASQTICGATSHRKKHLIDITKYNATYYDLATGVGLKAELEDSGRNPLTARIAFRGMPCQCQSNACNCCTGVNLTAINFDRRACVEFVYDPAEFAIRMTLLMNEREIYSNSLSARNPPPICTPFPYLPFVSFCIRFFDIYTEEKNLHTCIDLETRLVSSPILILHFNCVKMGADGISWSKPLDDGNVTLQMKPEVSEPEEYDEVEFEQQDLEIYVNYTSTLSPAEEAQIGQLKL